ncbi:MAG: hypothetical protein HC923_05845 [Myxococcales bacterium]|nr:hypothetical protein [Myxococcales bacterium]
MARGQEVDVEDTAPVDHRGRSRPLYSPRSGARPPTVSRWTRLVYGIFPGLRTMAFESFSRGVPFAVLGLLTLSFGVFLATSLEVTADVIERIAASPKLELAQWGLILATVLAFEVLRFGSSGVERVRGPRAPRWLSMLFLPSLVLAIESLLASHLWPSLCQATFFGAVIVFLGAVPAVGFCTTEVLVPPSTERRRLERIATGIYGTAILGAVLYLIVIPHPEWSRIAWYAGWDLAAWLLA